MADPVTIGNATLYHGDALEFLAQIAEDSLQVDAMVTDPPYHLTSIVKRFGSENAAPAKVGATGAFSRVSKGFMGQAWDGGDIAFRPETWEIIGRVIKPGGHLIALSHSRTYHRMVCAIEDAGFEIRDSLLWIFGTGFPKSHNIAKAVDKLKGAVGKFGVPKSSAHANRTTKRSAVSRFGYRPFHDDPEAADRHNRQYIPATPEAAEWQGWGTALKPAFKPIVLARKPLAETSIAAQCLATGTGALNIDGCRLDDPGKDPGNFRLGEPITVHTYGDRVRAPYDSTAGRWPANVVHDGMSEATAYMPDNPLDPSQSAQSYFYSAKADKSDRRGSTHPTVKPQSLMRWLVRLVMVCRCPLRLSC